MDKKGFKKDASEFFISSAEEQETEQPIIEDNHKKIKKNPKNDKNMGLDVELPEGYKIVKESKTERIQILVRPTTKKNLEAEHKAQKISINALINNILEDYFDKS